MTGIAEVVAEGGLIPKQPSGLTGNAGSAKRRGVKQGLFIFLLSFLIVPIIAILTIAANVEPYAVVISALLFSIGGILRIAYALMFESGLPTGKTLEDPLAASSHGLLNKQQNANALPPQQSVPAADYVSPSLGSWRDTNDLSASPGSVTDSTTKLLQKEQEN